MLVSIRTRALAISKASRATARIAVVLLGMSAATIHADITSYRFAGTVHENYVTPDWGIAFGWDPAIGDRIEGTFSFDTSLIFRS